MILEILLFIIKCFIGIIVMINVWAFILLKKLLKEIGKTSPGAVKVIDAAFHYITLPLAPLSVLFDKLH